jgi:hypothetical protein
MTRSAAELENAGPFGYQKAEVTKVLAMKEGAALEPAAAFRRQLLVQSAYCLLATQNRGGRVRSVVHLPNDGMCR